MAKVSSNGLSSALDGGADTIVASATPVGRGALAVVRVSGSGTEACASRVCPGLSFEAGWQAVLTTLVDADGEPLERAIAVPFPAPRSYTGENMLEVTVHGSPFVVESVVGAFLAAGARPARPGEFTRRAVANGKLDLVQAEAIRDMVAADTAWQHRNARLQLTGSLSAQLGELRNTIIALLALVEASLDYEAQAVAVAPDEVEGQLAECRGQLTSLLATSAAGERIRSGIQLVILGPPNAGKSTLFNHLCGTERAIVSPHPGTTRDVVEVEIDVCGLPLIVQDTAGLREGGDEVEVEGHRRAQAAASAADLAIVLWAADGEEEPADLPRGLPVIRVRSKIDLESVEKTAPGWLGISCVTGEGLQEFRSAICNAVLGDVPDLGGAVAIADRHRQALEAPKASVGRSGR
jgi:tRNA modification GTPase